MQLLFVAGITLDELKEQVVCSNLGEVEIATAQEGILKNFPRGISPCGADALRFTLLSQDVKSETNSVLVFSFLTIFIAFSSDQTICLDISQAHNYRNFCNKIWNSFKYAQTVWNSTSNPNLTKIKVQYSLLCSSHK